MIRKLSKRIGRAAVLIGGLLIAVVGPSSIAFPTAMLAQASTLQAPSTTLVSGITVQNLSNQSNSIQIQFYNPDGTQPAATTISATLAPLAQETWYTPTQTSLPSGFAGSAVVSGQFAVAAIFNTQTPTSTGTSTSDPIRVDTGYGADPTKTGQIGSTLYVPQVMSHYSGFYSEIYVQNASVGTGSPQTAAVTVTYKDRNGNAIPAATESASIAPGANHVFNQQANSNLGSLLGSAVVSASGGVPLAGIVNIFAADTDNTNAQLLTYNAVAAGGTRLYAPRIVNNYYGFSSGLTIQNLDPSTTANVTMTFNFPGSTPTVNASIPPQAAIALYLPTMTDGSGHALPSGNALGKGSAVITSNVNVNAIVNEDNRISPSFIGEGTTYNAFVDGTQTTTAFMPQITSCFYGYASGLTVQNVGSSAGSGTITLTGGGVSKQFPTGTIGPNSTQIYFAPNLWTSGNFNGSATVTFSQPVVAIANISFRGNNNPCSNPSGSGPVAGAYGDSSSAYNAINQ